MDGIVTRVQSAVEVAVPLPLPTLFSYFVPPEMEEKLQSGVRVRIPLKNREIIGYVVSKRQTSPEENLKSVISVLDDEAVLSSSMLELTRRVSEYYGSSWGEAIENALPRWVKYGKRAQKALLKQRPEEERLAQKPDFDLSPQQTQIFSRIQKALESDSPKPILIFGVTGSGKSELYIRVIREVLSRGKSAICLVPEIALTEQLKRFFAHHFGASLEVFHSKMTDSERFVAWKSIESGARRIILGPRSAVFAPCRNLGVILIDEEHEGSYKQETVPRYHAREVAWWRAQQAGALLIMGTATPSLETMARTEAGEVDRMNLTERIGSKPMPPVGVIDLKEYSGRSKKLTILSPPLALEMEQNLKKKEGTLLLLNRRGFSTHVHCPSCGSVESCKACHVSLTYHQEDEKMLCHYCNYEQAVSDICSSCKTPVLRFAGFGTEKVESEVAARFPGARIARLDTDSIRKRGSHEAILGAFRRHEIDILIGTQMIAKGFDFPHVTLVGVILADVGLSLPDFRSAERTFQLLAQVAGRAGRGTIPGRVLIQTYSPQHASVQCAKGHDFLAFYGHEKVERAEYGYPPCASLINLIVRGREENKTYQFARMIRDELVSFFDQKKKLLGGGPLGLQIIGPAPLPFYKLRGHFRWHVMLKNFGGDSRGIEIQRVLAGLKKPAGTAMALDVDPLNIL